MTDDLKNAETSLVWALDKASTSLEVRSAVNKALGYVRQAQAPAQDASASIEVAAEKIIENHIRMLDIGLGDEFRIPDAIATVRKEKSLAAANDLIGCIASWAAADIAKLLTDPRTPAEGEKQILDEIGLALESRGYAHMTNGRDIGILLDELEQSRSANHELGNTVAQLRAQVAELQRRLECR